jgi:hypothetical protein
MHLGFTGTRSGMTDEQKNTFKQVLLALIPTHFHHGDCLGADADAHDIVKKVLPACQIIIHPPEKTELRAYKEGHYIHETKGYLARNRDIVNDSDLLVGNPYQTEWSYTGGTWYTIDYAKKRSKLANIMWPDGTLGL